MPRPGRRAILEKLNAAAGKALRDPETAKKVAGMGVDPWPRSLDDADKLWRSEGEMWAEALDRKSVV